MTDERERLRITFDQAARLYDRARPGYPAALFDDVVALSGIPPGGRILEIGCGTGQATLPFARRGYRILCVELGENLAAVARQNLAAYPQVEVQNGAFEEWPVEEDAFDLAIAATAFHWIDPAVAYPKTVRALRSGGAIALFWNLHVQGDADGGIFEAVQEVYRREAPEIVGDDRPLPRPDEVPETVRDEIEQTGLFGEVAVLRYVWNVPYDTTSYIDVLDTYSGHRDLESATRARLYRGIARLINTEFHGRITKSYLTLCYIARRN
jgi:SAM-dependent methyltransferase